MTSVRERLAAKPRRRVIVPVDVTPSPAHAERLLDLQRVVLDGSGDVNQAVEAARVEAQVDVALVACTGPEFEAVVQAHPSEGGDDSGMNWRAALPVLAALCAEDPDLQDDVVWRDLLDSWSQGEALTLWAALLRLNTTAPSPHAPKG